MNTAQRRYDGNHDRRVRTPKKIKIQQYVYLDQPVMTTSAAEPLATELYRELTSSCSGILRQQCVL